MGEKTIVLFTKDADLSDEVRAAMIDAGYLPVIVSDLSAVKILSGQLSPRVMDDVTHAALLSVRQSEFSETIFGRNLAKLLLRSIEMRDDGNG